MGFDCVIEFCFFPPSSFLPSLFLLPVPSSSSSSSCSSFSGRKLEGRFFCRGWSPGSRTVPSVPVGSQVFFVFFFHSRVTMATPFQGKRARLHMCLCKCVCVYFYTEWESVCTCTPRSVCAPVCHVCSACAVTCSQISQRIYHPVNCL